MKFPLEDEIDDILNKAYRGMLADNALSTPDRVKSIVEQSSSRDLSNKELSEAAQELDLCASKLIQVAKEPFFESDTLPDHWKTIVLPFGPYTVNSHLLIDPERRKAVLFDAGTQANEILEKLHELELELEAIFITHNHRDHVGGIPELFESFPTVTLYANDHSIERSTLIKSGEKITFGLATIEAFQTNGHAQQALSFLVSIEGFPPTVVAGDAIFARSVGKIPADYKRSLKTIETKILSLQPETIILPGHGGHTTVRGEREANPFFHF